MTNYLKLVSIEIGNIADNVVSATFSNQIVSFDFSAGITIKVNGSIVQILSVKRLNDQRAFQYTISQSVISTDTITFSYLALPSNLSGIDKSNKYGDYVSSELGVVSLEDIGLLTVTNNVPSSDPIGDALRADTVAYWKMEESNGVRIDATGRGNGLTDVNSNVGSAAGKIGNAAEFTNLSTQKLRINSNADITVSPGQVFYFWCWVKMTAEAIVNGSIFYQKGLQSTGEFQAKLSFLDLFSFSDGSTNVLSFVEPLANTFYFVEALYTPSGGDFGRIGVAVNGESWNMADLSFDMYEYGQPLYICSSDDGTLTHDGLFDESGIMHRIPTSDERVYLYNSGAGRTLYP